MEAAPQADGAAAGGGGGAAAAAAASTVSVRCRERAHVRPAATAHFPRYLRAMEDQWSPSNPGGNLLLAIAENNLLREPLLARLAAAPPPPAEAASYTALSGWLPLKVALARLLSRTFLAGAAPAVRPEELHVANGAGTVLDQLAHCLGDAGDAVLVPRPYYPVFDADFGGRAGLALLPFDLPPGGPGDGDGGDGGAAAAAAALDAAAAAAAARGRRVAALLLTQPNNPLGIAYAAPVVRAAVAWCLRRRVHLISDEIYALSVYGEGAAAASPVALARAAAGGFPPADVDTFVHLVYGLSKDWCASGLRVGLLWTRNEELRTAVGTVAAFSMVPNTLAHQLADALADDAWVDKFLDDARAALRDAYDVLAAALGAEGIPFLPAVAGLFVWVDLRRALAAPTWAAEEALADALCDAGVFMAPGQACCAAEPGYFRLVFPWVPPAALGEAARRIGAVVAAAAAAAPNPA